MRLPHHHHCAQVRQRLRTVVLHHPRTVFPEQPTERWSHLHRHARHDIQLFRTWTGSPMSREADAIKPFTLFAILEKCSVCPGWHPNGVHEKEIRNEPSTDSQ